jgi:acetyl-CoA acetyltransferase
LLQQLPAHRLTHEQLAMVSVVQREWAAKNPRATFKTPITVEDVLNSRMIAHPSGYRGAVRKKIKRPLADFGEICIER